MTDETEQIEETEDEPSRDQLKRYRNQALKRVVKLNRRLNRKPSMSRMYRLRATMSEMAWLDTILNDGVVSKEMERTYKTLARLAGDLAHQHHKIIELEQANERNRIEAEKLKRLERAEKKQALLEENKKHEG